MIGTLSAVASIVDTDLAVRRQRMALRMAEARISLIAGQTEASERRAAFWRDVELDAEWKREQAKGVTP